MAAVLALVPLSYLTESVHKVALHKSIPAKKSVNLFFISVIINDKFADLCGNRLLQNDFMNTFCEVNLDQIPGLNFL